MGIPRLLASCMFVIVAGVPSGIYAAVGDVTVDFGGLCPALTDKPLPFQFAPSGTEWSCENAGTVYFKIKDSGGKATIEIPTTDNPADSSLDTLRLINAQIVAVTATPANRPQGYEITFWRQHTADPHTGSGLPDVTYKTSLTGSMANGASGNWVKLEPGYITNPITSGETALGVTKTWTNPCIPTCGSTQSFSSKTVTQGTWPRATVGELAGDRLLRAKFAFKLAANASITVKPGQIAYLSGAEEGENECSEQYCTSTPCLRKLFLFTSSTTDWTSSTKSTSGSNVQNKSAKIDTFTKTTWPSLAQDMVQGKGEYLASLAELLEVPGVQQPEFFALAQNTYHAQAVAGPVRRTELLSSLQESLTASTTIAKKATE
jgi:hypothetical protein